MKLQGKTVVITGASRGIGEAIAKECLAVGANVIGIARNGILLEQTMKRIGGKSAVCDLADSGAVRGLISRIEATYGPVDVLVNNAGVDHTDYFANATDDDVSSIIQINQITPIELVRQVLPGMTTRGSGHIVNVSSIAANGGFVGMSLYCSSKAGLSNFHRVLRHELASCPVRTTLVEVGPIPTDMLNDVYSLAATERSFRRMQRLGLLPEVSRERVAQGVRKAIEGEKRHVRFPRRAIVYPWLSSTPQKIIDLLLGDIARAAR